MSDSNKAKAVPIMRRGWSGWQWAALVVTALMVLTVVVTALVMTASVDTTRPAQLVSAPPPQLGLNGVAFPDPDAANPAWEKGDADLKGEFQQFFARFGEAVRSPTGNPLSFFDFHELMPPDPEFNGMPGPGLGPAPSGEFDPERFANGVIRAERMIWRGWDWKQTNVRTVKSLPHAGRYEAVVWHPAKDGTRVKIRWSLMRFGDHVAIVGWENLHTGVTAWDLVSAAAGAPWSRPSQDRRRFREVLMVHKHLDADRTDSARKVLESLQRVRFPKGLEYPIELAEARLALKVGDRAEVKAVCEALIQKDQTRLAAYPLLAEARLADEEYERVKEVCTSYMAVVGDDPDALALRAEAQYRLVETDEATADFEAALKLDPYQPLALSWKRRALPGDKKADVAQWLAAAPNPARLFDQLADAAVRDEDWPAALALAQKFRELRPADSRGAAKLIAVRCREKKFDDAVTVFREAIPKLSGPERKKLADKLYWELHAEGKEIGMYEAVPDDVAEYMFRRLAQSLLARTTRVGIDASEQMKALENVRLVMSRHAKRHPEDNWLSYSEGRLKLVEKDYTGAVQQFAKALAKMPRSGGDREDEFGYNEVRYQQVVALYKAGRGLEALRDAMPLQDVFGQLASSYVSDKDTEGLAKLLAERAKIESQPTEMVYWRAELDWLKKEYKAAVAGYREYLDSDEFQVYASKWTARERLIRSLVRSNKGLEAAVELDGWEQPPPVMRALALAAGGETLVAETYMRATLEQLPHMQDVFYRDEDLGPILLGEAFRNFREDFPPPSLKTIEPKK